MVRCFVRLSITTNGINNLPFVLSLSKDLFSVSLRAMNRQDAKSAKKNKSEKPFRVLKFDLLFLALLASWR